MNRATFVWIRALELLALIGLIIAFIFGAVGLYSNAQGADRIGIMPTSYHFDRDRYNETHHGIVFEHQLNSVNWLGIMHYTNSIDDPSLMIYGTNETYLGQAGAVDFGLMYGAVTGYGLPIAPFVVPTATLNIGDHIGVRGIFFGVGASAQLYLEF